MVHIPHLTIKTNMTYPQQKAPVGNEIGLNFDRDPVVYKNMVGFWCDVKEYGRLFMAVHYNRSELIDIKGPGAVGGIICCASTHSTHAHKWKIITSGI
tara:strand:- start:1029 stop:1322 length:294 start_codon:yes stop_codon:yes gene_type:complete